MTNTCQLLVARDTVRRGRKVEKRDGGLDADCFVALYQPSANVCLLQGVSSSTVLWSSAITDSVRGACISDDASKIASVSDTRCIVTEVDRLIELGTISLPQRPIDSVKQGCCVRFLPGSSTRVTVALSRDFRVFDVDQNSNKAIPAKSSLVVSGAAAQAVPVSFDFVAGSPHVIATGWELGISPYVRMLDLREGTSKSIRIWKSMEVKGLSSAVCDSNYLAGFSDSEIAVWDLRFSRGEDMKVSRITSDTDMQGFEWSRSKRNTLASLANNELRVCRTDVGGFSYSLPRVDFEIGGFKFTSHNDLAVMSAATGRVSVFETRSKPIPLFNPLSGSLECFTNGGDDMAETRFVRSVSSALYHQASLIDNLLQSGSLREAIGQCVSLNSAGNVEFFASDDMDSSLLDEPLHCLFSREESNLKSQQERNNTVLTSTERERALWLLLNEEERNIIVPMLRFDFASAFRAIVNTNIDEVLCRSVGRLVMNGVPEDRIKCSKNSVSHNVYSAVEIVNALLDSPECMHALIRNEGLSVFARASAAVTYLQYGLENELKQLGESVKVDDNLSLRHIVFDGLSHSEHIVSNYIIRNGPLQVALTGLFLKPRESVFEKSINFIRNEVCHRKQLWRLRAVIDAMTGKPSGSAVSLACYYCQKPISCDSVSTDSSPATRCPHRGCHKVLPACCVCLEPITISNMAELNCWCGTCKHGGHHEHLKEWFSQFEECPVAGCACQCSSVDGV